MSKITIVVIDWSETVVFHEEILLLYFDLEDAEESDGVYVVDIRKDDYVHDSPACGVYEYIPSVEIGEFENLCEFILKFHSECMTTVNNKLYYDGEISGITPTLHNENVAIDDSKYWNNRSETVLHRDAIRSDYDELCDGETYVFDGEDECGPTQKRILSYNFLCHDKVSDVFNCSIHNLREGERLLEYAITTGNYDLFCSRLEIKEPIYEIDFELAVVLRKLEIFERLCETNVSLISINTFKYAAHNMNYLETMDKYGFDWKTLPVDATTYASMRRGVRTLKFLINKGCKYDKIELQHLCNEKTKKYVEKLK